MLSARWIALFYPPCTLASLFSFKLVTSHICDCRSAVHCRANEGITKALPLTLFHFSYTWDLLGSEESNLIIEHTHYKSLFQRAQLTHGFQLFHLWTPWGWWQPVPSWEEQTRAGIASWLGTLGVSHLACSRIFKLCWGLRLFNPILLPSSFSFISVRPISQSRACLLTPAPSPLYSPEAPAPTNLLLIEFYLDVCFMEDPDQHMLMNSAGLSVPLSILRVSISEVVPSRSYNN